MDPLGEELVRRWESRGSYRSVVRRGVMSKSGMVVPYSPFMMCRDGRFYVKSWMSASDMIKDITKVYLSKNREKWKGLVDGEGTLQKTVDDISGYKVVQALIESRLGTQSSYVKRVLRDTFFEVLGYNRLVSKSSVRTEEEHLEKMGQIRIVRRKVLRRTSITDDVDMGWWRTCADEVLLENEGSGNVGSETLTDDIRAGPSDPQMAMSACHPNGTVDSVLRSLCQSAAVMEGGDVNGERDNEERNNTDDREVDAGVGGTRGNAEPRNDGDDDDTFGMFRNEVGRKVWECYRSTFVGMAIGKGGERREDDEDGNDSVAVEWSITAIARIDAWIMSVVTLLGDESKRGGGLQKKYVEKYEEYLPIAMRQLSISLYLFVKRWEPNDLKVWYDDERGDVATREEVLEHIFHRPFVATVPVHDTERDEVYLTIERSWFDMYVCKEMSGVIDAFVAILSPNMKEFIPISQ